jgi:plasmid segregation protein ParM
MRTTSIIDIGNGNFKIASSEFEGVKSYPAVVGQFSAQPNYNLADRSKPMDFLSFIKDGREHAIGNNAIKNCKIRNHDITEDKYVSETTMLLSNTALSMMATTSYAETNLILALPVHKMNDAGSIIRAFKGKEFGGQVGVFGRYESISKVISVANVIAIEQPWGTLFHTILDDKGVVNMDLAKQGLAVYDIGFKTNDGIVFRNLDMLGRLTIHSKNGMHIAFQEIIDKIQDSFNGLEVKIFEVPEIIRSGEVRGVAVSDIINDALYNLAYNVILEIKAKWSDAWEINRIIFTGGGSELLKPYLVQAFKDAMYGDSTTNAEGLLRYAKRVWGDVV